MNIGILGSGFIVEVFVENSKLLKDFNLYGIWGRHEEKIRKFTDFKVYSTDLDSFLKDPKIDVVYIALPNSLHYEYALKALKANKHVMLEKPFCTNYKQAKTLVDYAKKHKLFLFETIMTKYEPCYIKAKKEIKNIGDIKVIEANFSQYSRKYDKFKKGIILPAFDFNLAGGALMDLGVYNIHFIVGMFGLPKHVDYKANISRKIDTSGILNLDYGKFKVSLINAKDCKVPSYAYIQGDKGYIKCNTTTSRCGSFDIVFNDGKVKKITGDDNEFAGWLSMYKEFVKIYKKKDFNKCYEYLDETLMVQKVLDSARATANINFK